MVAPIIEIKAVSKSFRSGFFYKKSQALADLNLSIQSNEILGYLGPNGSGKTTTFKIILGLVSADRGQIIFNNSKEPNIDLRQCLGYLPENPYFYNYLTGKEILTYYGSLFGLSGDKLKKRIDYLLDLVNLQSAGSKVLKSYSRGMLQRVGIAQALINDPQVLILDEPMSGLDPYGRKEMRDIILACKEQNKTVIFSSHILSDVEMLCDRAAIILNGDLKDIVDVADILGREIRHWEVTSRKVDDNLRRYFEEKGAQFIMTHDLVMGKFNEKSMAKEFMTELNSNGLEIMSFIPHRESLEDIFVKYTAKAQ